MKSFLFSSLFFLIANCSYAQTPVPDTLNNSSPRDSVYFYVDGIRVRGCRGNRLSIGSEEVEVITGGIPIHYGDCIGSVIQINAAPRPKIPVRISDKEQKMATE